MYYFVTTDRLDQVSDSLGSQIGQTRLWRLTFDDITNPDAGGKIDLLIDGRTAAALAAGRHGSGDRLLRHRRGARVLRERLHRQAKRAGSRG